MLANANAPLTPIRTETQPSPPSPAQVSSATTTTSSGSPSAGITSFCLTAAAGAELRLLPQHQRQGASNSAASQTPALRLLLFFPVFHCFLSLLRLFFPLEAPTVII